MVTLGKKNKWIIRSKNGALIIEIIAANPGVESRGWVKGRGVYGRISLKEDESLPSSRMVRTTLSSPRLRVSLVNACVLSLLSTFQASGVEASEIPDDVKLMGFAQLSIS